MKPTPAERWVDANYTFEPTKNARWAALAGDIGTHRVAGVTVDDGLRCRWTNARRSLVVKLITAYRRSLKAEVSK